MKEGATQAHGPSAQSPRVLTVTVSDSRTAGTDRSGPVLRERLEAAGCALLAHRLVPDGAAGLRELLEEALTEGGVDAVVFTGGTGIAPRDQTVEALAPLFEKTLEGFGEAFRRLSWEQVGPRAVLSRACAGTVRGVLVVALPGSPNAVRLAVDALLGPLLPHAVGLLGTQATAPHH